MTSDALRRIISKLPDGETYTAKLEKAINLRNPYRSQKEHWLGWLGEYNGPGYYGRANWDRDAEFIYNHLQSATMLLWLGEALGLSGAVLKKAFEAVLTAGKNYSSQCAALRREIPWKRIEELINKDKMK
jgi:hypothetical protein